MIVKRLAEHHLEFLSLKGVGCRGSSKSTLVKMSNCWKSHAAAQISLNQTCKREPFTGHRLLLFHSLPLIEKLLVRLAETSV